MLSRETILSKLNSIKPVLEEKYSVKSIGLFGSYSRNDPKISSDIDILVDFEKPIGVLFIDLADELESHLHHKVDLVSLNGIKPQYLNVIQQDIIYV